MQRLFRRLSALALPLLAVPVSAAPARSSATPPAILVPVVSDFLATATNPTGYHTLVAITNRSSRNLFLHFAAFPDGESSCDRLPGLGAGQELTPGATISITAEEVATSLGANRTGHLEIIPSSEDRLRDLVVRARLYSESGGTTFGQEIPTLRSNEIVPTADARIHLVGLERSSSGTRTNLGIFVPPSVCGSGGVRTVPVEITGYWSSGQQNAPILVVDAPIGGLLRIDDVFHRLGQDECFDCRLAVRSPQTIVTYGSVVEAGTNDPTLVLGELTGISSVTIPGLAHAPGLSDSTWRSDLWLANIGNTIATASVVFVPNGLGCFGGDEIDLAAGETVHLEDVYSVPAELGHPVGTARIQTAGNVVARASTYNVRTSGRLGQSLPLVESDGFESSGGTLVLPGMTRTERYRSNLLLFAPACAGEIAGTDLPVEVTVRMGPAEAGEPADGTVLGSVQVAIPSGGQLQLADVLGVVSGGDCSICRIDVAPVDTDDDRPFSAIGSVIDNGSGDPTTITADRAR